MIVLNYGLCCVYCIMCMWMRVCVCMCVCACVHVHACVCGWGGAVDEVLVYMFITGQTWCLKVESEHYV